MSININFRDFLPELSVVNRDRKEIIRKLMDAYQENYEIIDGEIDGLLQITDVDVADEQFLDYIAALIGLELLGLDTAQQKRTLIKNAVPIYKVKGTEQSWQIIFRTLGFETDIIELWWDNTGNLTTTDPMFGHLSTGLDPINPELTILGRFTVAEFNGPTLNPLGRLTAAQITALLTPTTGDTYQVEDGGTINPGSVLVVADDLIQWDGIQWVKIPHYKTIDELTVDATRPQPSAGVFATTTINDITFPGPLPTITVNAGDVGLWGNDITVIIEDGTDPLTQFNLVVQFQAVEVARFDDLSKDLNQNLDNIEVVVNDETFYIDVESINTFGVELRPLSGVFPLTSGANPRNTKSAYIDIVLGVDFINCLIEAAVLNKAAFFDGRIKEVKPAHIRIRAKRIEVSVTEDADLVFDDGALTANVFAELVDVLQPECDPPPGAIIVFFHNGFIRARNGVFSRGYSINFPDGIPDDPGASSGIGGYTYAYDGLDVGSHGLTYGDLVDSIQNPFIYGFTFDPEVCATDFLEGVVDNSAGPFLDDDFYGVTIPARITYNGTFDFNGFMPFNDSPIDPANVDGDPADNPDPQGGVTVVRCNPTTDECILVLDWKFSDT